MENYIKLITEYTANDGTTTYSAIVRFPSKFKFVNWYRDKMGWHFDFGISRSYDGSYFLFDANWFNMRFNTKTEALSALDSAIEREERKQAKSIVRSRTEKIV